MRMEEWNTMRIKSEHYDIAILSYACHQLPLLEESISPRESMIYESTSNQKMRMDERNAMRLKSEPYDIAIPSYARHQLPLLEASISPWESSTHPNKRSVWKRGTRSA